MKEIDKVTIIGIILCVLPVLLYFAIKRQDEGFIGANKRRRFSILITAIAYTFIFIGTLSGFLYSEDIASLLAIDLKVVIIAVVISYIVGFSILTKAMYKAISNRKHKNEVNYRKKNQKNCKHYIIQHPVISTYNMLLLPPVHKYRKVTRAEMTTYHSKSLDAPPKSMQWLLMIIIFGLTTIGFGISDLIREEWITIYFSITVFPLLITIVFLGRPIIVLINFTKKMIGIKGNEMIEFLILNILIVLFVNGLWGVLS